MNITQSFWTQGHSYELYNIDYEQEKLIIRDPRGCNNKFNQEFNIISFDESIYLFTNMVVAKVYDDYVYSQFTLTCGKEKKTCDLIKIKLPSKMNFFTTCAQYGKSGIEKKSYRKYYKMSKVNLQVLKVMKNPDKSIKSIKVLQKQKFSKKFGDIELKQGGSLYFLVRCNWKQEFHRNLNFLVYGEKYVTIKQCKNQIQKIKAIETFLEEKKQQKQTKTKKTNSTSNSKSISDTCSTKSTSNK
eukprot:TRINITY_DN4016_c0_g12_i1.p3 TRINITY_DN4016_c0_g12~~TRINITY_DN4016_c0_g12_i1.p3  ORF type:complete len:243 (+),score=44.69 TRINITY_DN4016_c0_g12_i1:715-1443(+)